MSKADQLLRRLFNEAFMAETIEECRAYLNEKPHEPIKDADRPESTGGSAWTGIPPSASPPHAAAKPEKFRVEECNHVRQHVPCEADVCLICGDWEPRAAAEPEKPIAWMYDASPSAQPIAREPRVQITAEIADERERQVSIEDWSPAHDDAHDEGALAAAAASYALSGAAYSAHPAWKIEYTKRARAVWPFDDEFAKPKDARRDLIRAGALIVAEIERLDRAALKSAGKEST